VEELEPVERTRALEYAALDDVARHWEATFEQVVAHQKFTNSLDVGAEEQSVVPLPDLSSDVGASVLHLACGRSR